MTTINRNPNNTSRPASSGEGITWFPTSKEVPARHVWAHLPRDGFEPSMSDLREVAQMGGDPKKITKQDVEAYGQKGMFENIKMPVIMDAYLEAARSRGNAFDVVGRYALNVLSAPVNLIRNLLSPNTHSG